MGEVLFAGPHLTTIDDRFDYGEVRRIAIGPIGNRVFVCVYTDRSNDRRIISLRKANQREEARYDQGFE